MTSGRLALTTTVPAPTLVSVTAMTYGYKVGFTASADGRGSQAGAVRQRRGKGTHALVDRLLVGSPALRRPPPWRPCTATGLVTARPPPIRGDQDSWLALMKVLES